MFMYIYIYVQLYYYKYVYVYIYIYVYMCMYSYTYVYGVGVKRLALISGRLADEILKSDRSICTGVCIYGIGIGIIIGMGRCVYIYI